MRRAQLLSLDAILSLIIVVFILAAVTNTSSALKGEITSLVEWHERANIAEDMLDVLTKSPGEPMNWTLNTSTVIVPGLRSNSSMGIGLDYSKVYALFHGIKTNDSSIIRSLYSLSNHKDFQFAVFLKESVLNAILEYQYQQGNWLQICHVKDLVDKLGNPSDSPALIEAWGCPSGEFHFDHSDGESYNSYIDNDHICINGSVFIGDNFYVTSEGYMGVKGNLNVGRGGHLRVSNLYLEGSGAISDGADVTVSGDITSGGRFDIYGDGSVKAGGYGYFYNDVSVGNGGTLTLGKDMYVNGHLTIQPAGNLTIGGSAIINGPVNAEGRSYLNVGNELRINGPLTLGYSVDVQAAKDIYINGPANIYGKINSGGGLYINGKMVSHSGSETMVNGDLYVNGNLEVNGTITVHGNAYINGYLNITWGASMNVDGDLYVNGSVYEPPYATNLLNVKGNIYEHVSSLPWDESKLHITVNIPPMKHAPCFSSSPQLSVTANVTVNITYSQPDFYKDWDKLAVINGTLVNDPAVISESKERSPWIEHEERIVTLAMIKYEEEYNITEFTKPKKLYMGRVLMTLPPQSAFMVRVSNEDGNLTLISAFFRGDAWGYSVITLVKKNSKVYPFGEIVLYNGSTKIKKKCNSLTVRGNRVLIPLSCVILNPKYNKPTDFIVLLYQVNGFNWVDITAPWSLEPYLSPIYTLGKIELWVWDDS